MDIIGRNAHGTSMLRSCMHVCKHLALSHQPLQMPCSAAPKACERSNVGFRAGAEPGVHTLVEQCRGACHTGAPMCINSPSAAAGLCLRSIGVYERRHMHTAVYPLPGGFWGRRYASSVQALTHFQGARRCCTHDPHCAPKCSSCFHYTPHSVALPPCSLLTHHRTSLCLFPSNQSLKPSILVVAHQSLFVAFLGLSFFGASHLRIPNYKRILARAVGMTLLLGLLPLVGACMRHSSNDPS